MLTNTIRNDCLNNIYIIKEVKTLFEKVLLSNFKVEFQFIAKSKTFNSYVVLNIRLSNTELLISKYLNP